LFFILPKFFAKKGNCYRSCLGFSHDSHHVSYDSNLYNIGNQYWQHNDVHPEEFDIYQIKNDVYTSSDSSGYHEDCQNNVSNNNGSDGGGVGSFNL
jgi:hypothetical protein